jgi:hypothetical protein
VIALNEGLANLRMSALQKKAGFLLIYQDDEKYKHDYSRFVFEIKIGKQCN